jgi:site-specific recombinase XerD
MMGEIGVSQSSSRSLHIALKSTQTEELPIRGAKGRRDRLGYATNGSADPLKEWLVARGGDPGPLSCSSNKGGRITVRRLTDQAVLHVLKKRAVQASVASFSPHDLRRSFISDLLDAGADISTAQQLAGHSNVQTTARYDRRGEATKRKAAELLHVPYRRRFQQNSAATHRNE